MITSPDIQLHPFERSYLEETHRWVNDPSLAHLLGRERPVTKDEHERWYQGIVGSSETLIFAMIAPETKVHIGNIWLWDIDRRHAKAEIRILIGETSFQGMGKGSQAIRLVSQYAFDVCHLHKLYAYVMDFNIRGRKAFEKAGFQLEGMLKQDRWSQGKFVDVALLGYLNPSTQTG